MTFIFNMWFWFSIFALLLGLEIYLGIIFFILPFAIGAFAIGLLLLLEAQVIALGGGIIFSQWYVLLGLYSALSVVSLLVMRRFFKNLGPKKSGYVDEDVNDY